MTKRKRPTKLQRFAQRLNADPASKPMILAAEDRGRLTRMIQRFDELERKIQDDDDDDSVEEMESEQNELFESVFEAVREILLLKPQETTQ